MICVFSEAGRDKLCECEIAVSISDLLGTTTGDELQDSILELLANLAESGKCLVRDNDQKCQLMLRETCASPS